MSSSCIPATKGTDVFDSYIRKMEEKRIPTIFGKIIKLCVPLKVVGLNCMIFFGDGEQGNFLYSFKFQEKGLLFFFLLHLIDLYLFTYL